MSSIQPPLEQRSHRIEPLSDEDEIWRRIPPGRLVLDQNQQRYRPSSDCFKDHPNGTAMSAYSAAITDDPKKILVGHEDFGVAALSIKELRYLGLTVVLKPEPDQEGHVEVVGKKTDAIRSKLAKQSRMIILPRDP